MGAKKCDPEVFERAAADLLGLGSMDEGMCGAICRVAGGVYPDHHTPYGIALGRWLRPDGAKHPDTNQTCAFWGWTLGLEGRIIALLLMAELARTGDL